VSLIALLCVHFVCHVVWTDIYIPHPVSLCVWREWGECVCALRVQKQEEEIGEDYLLEQHV